MQDFACKISKIFRGHTPGPPWREGSPRPPCIHFQHGWRPCGGAWRPGFVVPETKLTPPSYSWYSQFLNSRNNPGGMRTATQYWCELSKQKVIREDAYIRERQSWRDWDASQLLRCGTECSSSTNVCLAESDFCSSIAWQREAESKAKEE
jgi:hypothetical protein